MISRVFLRKFTEASSDLKNQVLNAVRRYADQRKSEIQRDKTLGNWSESEAKINEATLLKLSQQVTEQSNWVDLGFDGLDEVECVLTIEDAVNVRVPDDEFQKARGIQDVLKLISQYQAPSQ